MSTVMLSFNTTLRLKAKIFERPKCLSKKWPKYLSEKKQLAAMHWHNYVVNQWVTTGHKVWTQGSVAKNSSSCYWYMSSRLEHFDVVWSLKGWEPLILERMCKRKLILLWCFCIVERKPIVYLVACVAPLLKRRI